MVPFEKGERFFLDGAPVTAIELDRIKIIAQGPFFQLNLLRLNREVRSGDAKTREVAARTYNVRLEALVRETGVDVTGRVLDAFATAIKPSLKDYLPKKESLLAAAVSIFNSTVAVLAR